MYMYVCITFCSVIFIVLFFFHRDVVDEEYIKTLFASTGGAVQNFRFFQ